MHSYSSAVFCPTDIQVLGFVYFWIKMLCENAVPVLGFLSLICACKSELLAIAAACLLHRHALKTCTLIQQVC